MYFNEYPLNAHTHTHTHTRIAPRGQPDSRDANDRTRSGAESECYRVLYQSRSSACPRSGLTIRAPPMSLSGSPSSASPCPRMHSVGARPSKRMDPCVRLVTGNVTPLKRTTDGSRSIRVTHSIVDEIERLFVEDTKVSEVLPKYEPMKRWGKVWSAAHLQCEGEIEHHFFAVATREVGRNARPRVRADIDVHLEVARSSVGANTRSEGVGGSHMIAIIVMKQF